MVKICLICNLRLFENSLANPLKAVLTASIRYDIIGLIRQLISCHTNKRLTNIFQGEIK